MKTLITQAQIAARVAEMGAEITAACNDGTPTVLLMAMNGAALFGADLARQLRFPVFLDSLGVSSYSGTSSTGLVQTRSWTKEPVAGRRVLLVDDIFETGATLEKVAGELLKQGALSVETAVMLCKQVPRRTEFRPRWTGFDIPDRFVVGYGMDYDGLWRNLPDICEMEPSDLQ